VLGYNYLERCNPKMLPLYCHMPCTLRHMSIRSWQRRKVGGVRLVLGYNYLERCNPKMVARYCHMPCAFGLTPVRVRIRAKVNPGQIKIHR